MWEEQGIYDLIQLSRVGPRYNPTMLFAVTCSWETYTNTFQLPCRMVTPILFDLVVIAGLRPSAEDYEPYAETNFNFSSHTYNTIIGEHQGSGGVVDAHEHIAFLTYWMCRYVFCPGGIQISKMYASLATLLHGGGVNVSLRKLILASLYEPLGNVSEYLRRGVDNFQTEGPI